LLAINDFPFAILFTLKNTPLYIFDRFSDEVYLLPKGIAMANQVNGTVTLNGSTVKKVMDLSNKTTAAKMCSYTTVRSTATVTTVSILKRVKK